MWTPRKRLALIDSCAQQDSVEESRIQGRNATNAVRECDTPFEVTQTSPLLSPAAVIASPVSFSVPYTCAVSICRIPAFNAAAPASTAVCPELFSPPVPFLRISHATKAMSLECLNT